MGEGDAAEFDRLVERADLDELVRAVDVLGERRDWEGLLDLRRRCRFALGTGRQLWPVGALIEYRVALRAPAAWAAQVLAEDAGWFAPGPLTEVAASTHAWAELAEHLEPGAVRTAFCAHERVVRGEDLRGDARVDGRVLEVPLALAAWEPRYPLATYRDDGAEFPAPPLPAPRPVALPAPGPAADDRPTLEALRALVEPWATGSNGRVEVVAVEGRALGAVAALGPPSDRVRAVEIRPAAALGWLAWAGASGGAHGRRRGMATGRSGAWWVLTALAGWSDEGAPHPDELGAVAGELRWWWWDATEPATGWRLQLAVEDPADGLAWAIAASDAA